MADATLRAESPEKPDVVILAGGINRIAMFPGNRPGRKALLPMRGRPLISYVLDALKHSETVGRILVVAHPEVLEYVCRWQGVEGIREGYSLIRNARRGLLHATSERVLFCNPDQPLLTPAMIDDFVRQGLAKDADIVSSWVEWSDIGPYEEEGEHKFERFGDGRFAHGNLFLVRRDIPEAPQVRKRLEGMYAGRKHPVKFAWAMGPGLFARFLWARMRKQLPSLQETLNIAGRHFGVRIVPVVCACPEIALDVDEPEDYAAAVRHLEEREARLREARPLETSPAAAVSAA